MFKPNRFAVGISLMLAANLPAQAAPNLNDEVQDLKARLLQLESLVQQQAEVIKQLSARADTPPPADAGTAMAAPIAAAPASSGNAFNPRISLILDGAFANYSASTPPLIPGFVTSDEASPRPEGFSLGETELALEANVDDKLHGWTTISLSPEGGVGVEEAYVNTLSLPAGLAVKMGRFFSDIGYQNHQHAHAWEFVDAPLVYRAMLGNQLGDDGLQLRWLAPTDLFLELGAEALRGASFPAGGDHRNGIRGFAGFAHLGGDIGPSGSWRLGLSHLNSQADNRRTEDAGTTAFSGSSNLSIVDAVYKWAPNGNAADTNFVGQAEYFYRREGGSLLADPDGAADFSSYRGSQQGYYLQGVYQFMPRWRAGLRYDHLSANNSLSNPLAGTGLALLADNSHDPQRYSLMVDFSNSEFSRVRLQFNRDESRPGGEGDNQIFAQYLFSLGSHPAHQF